MKMTGSWGVSLNDVYLSGGSDASFNLSAACADQINAGCLTEPPQGLGLPPRRTEDVTRAQRDGVVHYYDWYEARIITLERVIVCDDGCGGSYSACSARQKVRDLLQAWSRTCCDTELVIYTPCNSVVYDSVPTPSLTEERTNLFAYNSMGQTYTENCGTFEFRDTRGFGSATGEYSNYIENLDLPVSVSTPMTIARKTWATESVFYCRDYDEDGGDHRCYISCLSPASSGASGYYYDNEVPGSNDEAGFIMGCTGVDAFSVTELDTYTFSGYMRASITGANMLVRVLFYGPGGTIVSSEDGTIVESDANTWSRVSHTASVPVGAETVQFALDLADGGTPFGAGDTLDATAVLVEQLATLGEYFDGNFANTDDRELGGEMVVHSWETDEYQSNSIKKSYVYIPGRDRALNGPFGIVGRPRVAEVTWQNHGAPCASVLLRFDAVDHRMYILDECGTPGSSECVEISPGAQFKCRSYAGSNSERCYGEDTGVWCYDNDVEGSLSVDPTEVDVLGTETAFPTITLNGPLTRPRVQDLTGNKSFRYQGNIGAGDAPVIFNAVDGIAYQNGISVTHLLDGNLDFSFEPGRHDLRLNVQSIDDTGTADVCWRPAVVSA